MELDPSPIVALNRAVALAHVHGPRAGIEAVRRIAGQPMLESYYLLHAVLADFESQLRDHQAAAKHLRRALDLAELRAERALLSRRLQELEAALPAPAGGT